MTRRAFLGGGAATAALAAVAAGPGREYELLRCRVAGMFYYVDLTAVDRLIRPGDRLGLVREPANDYDRDAVAVYRGRTKVGYLPRDGNRVPASLLDQGARLRAEVVSVEGGTGVARPVEVAITMARA